jgi:hypothetical protein
MISATFLLLGKWPTPCVMLLERNQMVQSYRLRLVYLTE